MTDTTTTDPTASTKLFIGMDMGDKNAQLALRVGNAKDGEEATIAVTPAAMTRYFAHLEPCDVAMEVGTHSRWVSNLLMSFGHTVVIANARKLRMIYESDHKDDRSDAKMLVTILQFKRELLYPIKHRGDAAQDALAVLRARDLLVRTRTKLVNHIRGVCKSSGARMRSGSAEGFHHRELDELPENRREALSPLMELLSSLADQISLYDAMIAKLSKETFPETETLSQPSGVGPITALAFAATVEDPKRFPTGRDIGSYVGLVPKLDRSSTINKQLGITKSGDGFLRRLLVGAAQHILGPFGPDSDLRRWGLEIGARGGGKAKKRALVAVARKVAVLLLSLWKHQSTYEPLRNANKMTPLPSDAMHSNTPTATLT